MTTLAHIKQLQSTVSRLVEAKEKPLWVKVTFIVAKTGWNKEQMRRAREQGLVEFEKRADGFWYNIKSLDPILFK